MFINNLDNINSKKLLIWKYLGVSDFINVFLEKGLISPELLLWNCYHQYSHLIQREIFKNSIILNI